MIPTQELTIEIADSLDASRDEYGLVCLSARCEERGAYAYLSSMVEAYSEAVGHLEDEHGYEDDEDLRGAYPLTLAVRVDEG